MDIVSGFRIIEMNISFRDLVSFTIIFCGILSVSCNFFECHNDPMADPEDGVVGPEQFTWLGLLQYIHVRNATPHYFRAPRVVLISKQFVLATAVDAAQVPDDYALGNVVFSDYERDEAECGISIEELAHGVLCDPAVLLMPIADVLLHPEYKHFRATDSLAILKLIMPVKSSYLVPACLPFSDIVLKRRKNVRAARMFHVDFPSESPRDFLREDKEVVQLHLLPRELCYLYDNPDNGTFFMKKRIACTTGCNFHSGAPTLVHERTGHWAVVALSEGGSPCPDPMRPRRPPAPPRHILLHPYVPWITAAISGKPVGADAKDDPFGLAAPSSMVFHMSNHGWIGHWWMGGRRCYDRDELASDMFKFYHEIFQIKPTTQTYFTYHLEVFAGHGNTILCAKIGMPYRLGTPKVRGLDTPVASVNIPAAAFKATFRFIVEIWGINTTESSSTSESDFDSASAVSGSNSY